MHNSTLVLSLISLNYPRVWTCRVLLSLGNLIITYWESNAKVFLILYSQLHNLWRIKQYFHLISRLIFRICNISLSQLIRLPTIQSIMHSHAQYACSSVNFRLWNIKWLYNIRKRKMINFSLRLLHICITFIEPSLR